MQVKSLSHVRLFATRWTVAYQAPTSMGFSKQEYCSGLPFPSPWDLPSSGIEPRSPALQADALPSAPSGKPNSELIYLWIIYYYSHMHINSFFNSGKEINNFRRFILNFWGLNKGRGGSAYIDVKHRFMINFKGQDVIYCIIYTTFYGKRMKNECICLQINRFF